ncbi:MAG: hypothetical protein AAGA83_14575 [Cyanobacteria bacterium P01_F01_bin.116]
MQQSITPDDVISVDNNQTSFVDQNKSVEVGFGKSFVTPSENAFELQEKWINAIAHCPLLSPDHVWKDGSLQIRIGFIPAEPCIDGELI